MKHFWYLGWPDHKAPPATVEQLLELVRHVETYRTVHRQKFPTKSGAVAVHCRYYICSMIANNIFKCLFLSLVPVSDERDVLLRHVSDVNSCAKRIWSTCSALRVRCVSIGINTLFLSIEYNMFLVVCSGGMIQTPEQYEFVHHALSVYERQLPDSPNSAPLSSLISSSSSASSTPVIASRNAITIDLNSNTNIHSQRSENTTPYADETPTR